MNLLIYFGLAFAAIIGTDADVTGEFDDYLVSESKYKISISFQFLLNSIRSTCLWINNLSRWINDLHVQQKIDGQSTEYCNFGLVSDIEW